MSMLGRDADQDPLDYSRTIIADAADKASRYAGMALELIEMRDDDRARMMAGAAASQMKAMSAAFDALAAGRRAQPANDAAAHFSRLPDKPDQGGHAAVDS